MDLNFFKDFNYFIFFFMLILIMIYKFKNYFIMILISMEFMVVLILMMIFFFELNCMNDWMFLYYLIFSVCESIIGISLMINMIYMYGNQNINMLNLKW